MIRFTTSVRIARTPEDVFAYVSDPTRFPDWNSAVEQVEATSRPPAGVPPRYRMRRALPRGRISDELEIVASEPPRMFAIRAASGPMPFLYRYSFAPVDGGTLVRLVAEVELTGAHALTEPLLGRLVRRGVDANLATLQALLEGSYRRACCALSDRRSRPVARATRAAEPPR